MLTTQLNKLFLWKVIAGVIYNTWKPYMFETSIAQTIHTAYEYAFIQDSELYEKQ